MNKNIAFYYLLLFFTAITSSYAQEELEPVDTNETNVGPGFIITNSKDTLFGTIQYKTYTMKTSVMYINTKTGKSTNYDQDQIIKYAFNDRTMVSMPSQFVELIYKGKSLNLYKLREPVIGPMFAALGVGATITAVSAQGWLKTNCFYFRRKDYYNKIRKISNKKVLLDEVIDDVPALVQECQNKKWSDLKNDSTLLSIFRRYNGE